MLDLLVELHRRQVVWHRHIVERVAYHDVVAAVLKLGNLQARVSIVRNYRCISRHAKILVRYARNRRIDLDDLLAALRIRDFEEARHRIAAAADVQRAELRFLVPDHCGDVRENLLVAIHKECRVVQIYIAMYQSVESERPHLASLYLSRSDLDAEVVALHLALCFERVGRKPHSRNARKQDECHRAHNTHPPHIAEHHSHHHEEYGDAKQYRTRADPLDEHEAGYEHAEDASGSGHRVYLADHIAGLRQVAQPQLDDHRRNHAQDDARH